MDYKCRHYFSISLCFYPCFDTLHQSFSFLWYFWFAVIFLPPLSLSLDPSRCLSITLNSSFSLALRYPSISISSFSVVLYVCLYLPLIVSHYVRHFFSPSSTLLSLFLSFSLSPSLCLCLFLSLSLSPIVSHRHFVIFSHTPSRSVLQTINFKIAW